MQRVCAFHIHGWCARAAEVKGLPVDGQMPRIVPNPHAPTFYSYLLLCKVETRARSTRFKAIDAIECTVEFLISNDVKMQTKEIIL